jgi:hypothetical protein
MSGTKKIARVLGGGVALIVALSGTAQAFDASPGELPELGDLRVRALPEWSASAVDAAGDEDRPERWIDRLTSALERIPLRPVKIGREPRRPDDPEVGVGLVLRIAF